MEDTLIQQEFENLIEQLERLKKINELTAANEESARKVIDEITSFVKSTSELKEKIEGDYDLKARKIEDVIRDLDNTALSFQKDVSDLSESLSDSNLSLQKDVRQDLNNLHFNVKDELNQTAELINSFRTSFTENIQGIKDYLSWNVSNDIKDLQVDLSNNSAELISEVKDIQSSISKLYNLVQAEQATSRKEFRDAMESNFIAIRDENKKEFNVFKILIGILLAISIGLAVGIFI